MPFFTSHQLCLSPEHVIYWTCPWVDAFPYLGYIILYSSLNIFWVLRKGWSKVVLCYGFLQKLQGEFWSVLIFKSPTLIFFVLPVTWCRAKINNHEKINFNYHVLQLMLCICYFSDIVFLKSAYVYSLWQAYICVKTCTLLNHSQSIADLHKQVLWYHEQDSSIRSSVVFLLWQLWGADLGSGVSLVSFREHWLSPRDLVCEGGRLQWTWSRNVSDQCCRRQSSPI